SADLNRTAVGCVIECIIDEVGQDAGNFFMVDADAGQGVWRIGSHLNLSSLMLDSASQVTIYDFADKLGDIYCLQVEARLARFNARNIEKVIDQNLQTMCILFDDLKKMGLGRGKFTCCSHQHK